MNVFVESNYVLEVALKQPEEKAALAILELAEARKISLRIPAYSLVEPYEKLFRDRRERRLLRDGVERQVEQMARSSDFAELRKQSNDLLTALANKSDLDTREFESLRWRIQKCAVVLPLTGEVVRAAAARQLLDLEPQDAVVFASIEADLKSGERGESVFACRDAKGFMQQAVNDDLAKWGCKVLPHFNDAYGYLKSRLKI